MPESSQNIPPEIIAAFRQGETGAFNWVYNQLYPSLRYFANTLIHDEEEARDIVVETFIKLINLRERFESFVNIRAFLYITVRNACFDYLRFKKRDGKSKKEILQLGPPEELPLIVEREQIRTEVLEAIYREIENLPPQCKKIFQLVYIRGLTTKQIAVQMDIEPRTVLNQKNRALQLLRTALLKKNLLPVILFVSLAI